MLPSIHNVFEEVLRNYARKTEQVTCVQKIVIPQPKEPVMVVATVSCGTAIHTGIIDGFIRCKKKHHGRLSGHSYTMPTLLVYSYSRLSSLWV
jgi:hypothetical protein